MGFFRGLRNIGRKIVSGVKSVVKTVVKTAGKVVGNVARGIGDTVKTVGKVVGTVVDEITGARKRREALEDLRLAAAEQEEAQASYDKQAAEIKEQSEKQKTDLAAATAEQDAAIVEAERIDAETQEKTRVAELTSKRISASSGVQAQIDAAASAQREQQAALAAADSVPDEVDGFTKPAIARTPIQHPVPGGYGGTDPGAINPTGLNI